MEPNEQQQPVDATQFNRKERRKLEKQLKVKIPGRNLPYQQKLHGDLKEFFGRREIEMKELHRMLEGGGA